MLLEITLSALGRLLGRFSGFSGYDDLVVAA